MPNILTKEQVDNLKNQEYLVAYGTVCATRDLIATLEVAWAKLAEVRTRVIYDFFTSPTTDSPHWWCCRACKEEWQDGEAEKHEPGCPLEALDSKVGGRT